MFLIQALKRIAKFGERLPVRWPMAVLFAIAIAYADGFWMTAIQGAVGAMERKEPPFTRWLRDATLMIPLVTAAVLLALLCAHRWMKSNPQQIARLGGAVLMVALFGSAVGVAEAANSSLEDYRLQVRHMGFIHANGNDFKLPATAIDGFSEAPYALYCDLRGTLIGGASGNAVLGSAITRLEYATFSVHVRAVLIDAALILITNVLIAGAIMAVLRDRVWSPRVVARAQPSEAMGQLALGGTLV
jgi:hypothetical protein